MNYALLVSLAATALATPPACLLACVAEVSRNSDSCSNALQNIACIFSSLDDDLNKCLDSKCPNDNADAAKSAFTSAAEAQGATASSSASSSAESTAASTEAESTAAPSTEAESSAASTEAESKAESSAAPTKAESSAAPTKAESKAESSAAPTKAESSAASSKTAPVEKPSSHDTSVAPGNGAMMVGSSVGIMGAFAAAVLL